MQADPHLYCKCSDMLKAGSHDTAKCLYSLFSSGIGSKKNPLHMLVVHGSISIRNSPKIDSKALREWFETNGNVEGIVWHCENKHLFNVGLICDLFIILQA